MNDRFLRALRRQPVDRTPLWIMRQAGRYLPEYRELKARSNFITMCKTPELAVEASLQPLRRFSLDAAIIFSDIMVPIEAMGCGLTFDPGPRLAEPVRTRAQVEGLSTAPMAEIVPYVGEAVALLRRELDGRVPVIGFSGAPFTLAAYMVEGQGRNGFGAVMQMLYREPATLTLLLEKLADAMADYLDFQIRSGAQAVQLFDSWAGLLGPAEYRRFALPAVQRVIKKLDHHDVPIIYFAVAADHVLEDAARSGADALGLCWRTSIAEARRRTGDRLALQGNLNPYAMFASPDVLRAQIVEVLEDAGDAPGHVMNLGHGILPETPIESVEILVETVASQAGRPA
jgi:uroporphyrinogen decarboxylase